MAFDFATVEEALCRINRISEEYRVAFKGRINNLKRLGVVPSSGGRGKPLIYSFDDAMLLALCLELAQFGINPSDIKKIITFHRKKDLIETFNRIAEYQLDRYIFFVPTFSFVPMEKIDVGWRLHQIEVHPGDRIDGQKLRELLGRRSAVVNLTVLRRELENALSAAPEAGRA